VPHQRENPPTDFLKVPQGCRVQRVAEGLEHPRWMAVSENGDIFVVESRLEIPKRKQPNQVTVLRDADGDGVAEERHLWADKLYLPFGISFHQGYLYVANTGSVVRWPYKPGDLQATGASETVLNKIPERGMRQHWTRNLLFSDKENSLYVTVGSKENADVEESPRGSIIAYSLDSTGKPEEPYRIIANGMRNPVGLALHPMTGKLWAVVNERDYLGDDLVPDFFTEVRPGGFYGWPYYYLGNNPDPRVPARPDLKSKVLLPDVLLDAHSAPLGLVFTPDGRNALIARHGSQNRSRKVGYDVVRVRFDAAGHATGKPETIISGWLPDPREREVNGRPAGLAWAKDGSLLIADDWGGRIWRIVGLQKHLTANSQ
jgi:glucose/arabinose dehydrogenase